MNFVSFGQNSSDQKTQSSFRHENFVSFPMSSELFRHVRSFVTDPLGVSEEIVDAIKEETKTVYRLDEPFTIAPYAHPMDDLVVFQVVLDNGDWFTVRVDEQTGIERDPPFQSSLIFSTDTDFLLSDLRCDVCDRKGFTLEDVIWTDYDNLDVCEECHQDREDADGLHMCSVQRRISAFKNTILKQTGFQVSEEDERTGI